MTYRDEGFNQYLEKQSSGLAIFDFGNDDLLSVESRDFTSDSGITSLIGAMTPNQVSSGFPVGSVSSNQIIDLTVGKLTSGTIKSKTITLDIDPGRGDVFIASGKTDFTNTDSGFILGVDDSDSDTAKFYLGDATNYLNWTGSALNISGSITATSGTIGSFTIGTYLYTGSKTAYNDANAGVHLGSDGIGIGNNIFTVSSAGALVATSATITGAITATSGTFAGITSAEINVGTTGNIRGGQTAYNTGTGFWLGYDTDAYKLSIGSTNQNLTWDGTNFSITTNVDNAININSGGSIRINDGGDILLRSDVSNPAEVRFYTQGAPSKYINVYQESGSTLNSLVDSYSESNANNYEDLGYSNVGAGQSFTNTPAGQKITSCKFYLKKFGSPTGNAVAKLYSHSGTYGTSSVPNTLLATSDNFDVSTLTTSYQLIEFTFTGAQQYTMSATTKYVITIEYVNAGGFDAVSVGLDTSSSTHDGNASYNIGAWGAHSGKDLTFYVYNDAVDATTTGILFDASADAISPYIKFDTAITVKVDTIGETTSANGVTIDGVKLKDSEVTTDVINEKTGANGVTIDSLNIKDGKLNTNNSVVTANITNASVTPDKISLGPVAGEVITSETTTSTSYTDLATAGPSAAVTIGANGFALVVLYCASSSNTATANQHMGFALSGANTLAASDNFSNQVRQVDANSAGFERQGATFLMGGLTAGATTFTAKYKVNAGTGTFSTRRIAVIPL